MYIYKSQIYYFSYKKNFVLGIFYKGIIFLFSLKNSANVVAVEVLY